LDGSQELIHSFLQSKRDLILEFLKQKSGLRISHKYADLMDQFIRSLFLSAGFTKKIKGTGDNGLAIMALGSYGRREFCFESDVDLMVIHQGRLPPEMNEIITGAIYPLWDAKLEVGYSVFSVQECIRSAINDFRVLTSVMDGRFLLGSLTFCNLFEEAFWSRIYREKKSLLKQFFLYQQNRIEKYGSEGYFLEPDIKEGIGGLRDIHFMAWVARIYFKCKRLGQLRRFSVFSHFGFEKLSQSANFLLKVRNHLHVLSRRKEDHLLLSYRKELSHNLLYRDASHITASEKFMRHLYLHLNRIRFAYEEFLAKALDIIDPVPSETSPKRLPPEFRVMKGNLVLKQGSISEKEPIVILRALKEASRLGLFLGSEFIWEAKKIVIAKRKGLLASSAARDLFLEIILQSRNLKVIRLALEIGLVTTFIPEFKKIRNLPESGLYHVETVDLHCLRAIEIISEISKGTYDARWPLFKEIFTTLEHPDWLSLAAFLHDIGKGYGVNHSEKGAKLIPKILKRLGIKGKAFEVIPFLVTHHLLLTRVSQRRDLTDEKTAVQVAQTIRDKDLLQMLFLLTVADSFSTGPIARSDWKILLIVELFVKVKRILEKGGLASPHATKRIEDNKRLVLDDLAPHFPENSILELADQVSSRYFLNTAIEDIICHFQLALTMRGEKFLWKLKKLTDAPITRMLLCSFDMPGLFSKMAGIFALNNIEVLSVRIFTLKNGMVFDTYEVINPQDPYREEEKWDKIHKEFGLALEDRLPIDELITRKERMRLDWDRYQGQHVKKIQITNDVSDFFTVIEVSSAGKVGLLYKLAKQILSSDLDVRFARFNRDKEKITGDFYVRDQFGQKIHDKRQIDKIKQGMLTVL